MPDQNLAPIVEDFISFSKQLPSMERIEYELVLTNYAAKHIKELEFNTILTWFKAETEKANTDEVDERLLFSTFFLLCIYSRRMKNYSVYKELLDKYEKIFEREALYPHLLSMYYKNFNSKEDMEWTIEYAREAVKNLPEQVGVLHNYVEAIVTAKENGLEIEDSLWTDAQEKMKEVIKRNAKHKLYAKFHCTNGRLLALLKKFADAKEAIQKAIDQEDSTSNDYSLRINEYQSQLMRIQTLETSEKILSELESTKKEIEDSKKEIEDSKQEMKVSMKKLQRDNLQFLGFFVAIITLTIGSFNLIGDKTFLETALLLLILTGSIILAYACLGFISHLKKSGIPQLIVVLLIGIVLIVGSISAYLYIS